MSTPSKTCSTPECEGRAVVFLRGELKCSACARDWLRERKREVA